MNDQLTTEQAVKTDLVTPQDSKIPERKESTELTKSSAFKPTPSMIVWLDVALHLMTDNITEIETESNITAQAWYKWQKDENFRAWFNDEWNKRLKGQSWKLDAIGMKFAKRGDYNFWKTMRESTGKDQGPSEEMTFTWRKK